MKTEPQRNADLALIADLVGGSAVGMLTTTNDEGALVSQPMAALQMDEDGAIWFFIDLRSDLGEHLRSVNLAFSREGQATYVSLSGRGEVSMDRERIRQFWTAFATPWFPDGPDSRHLALLKFVPDTASYWDAPNSRMVRLLAVAASALVGKPVGRGDHDTLNNLSSAVLDTRLPDPRDALRQPEPSSTPPSAASPPNFLPVPA
ncbi:hypothetical protein BH11PSE8_BH11PSE8_03950 [soil metagenome]